jgi:methylated-DNA-[protein]-cysteine S-methyltransferase
MVDSPLGPMLVRTQGEYLTGLFFDGQKYYPDGIQAGTGGDPAGEALLDRVAAEVSKYFAGELDRFTVPVHFAGSDFQRRVWQALLDIPFGETVSYGDIGAALGLAPSHSRAVGGAVGRNPVSVIVPCHRVVGASGALTGYAGGMERKRALLKLEGSLSAPDLPILRQATLALE